MCGVGAIVRFTGESVVDEALELMAGLQNRGQEACGIAVAHTHDRTKLTRIRKTAIPANETLADPKWLQDVAENLQGNAAIIHTRYATALDSERNQRAAQPHFHEHNTERLVVASNGDIPYCTRIRRELEEKGYRFASKCDAEVLAHLLGEYIHQVGMTEEDAFLKVCGELDAAFSLVAILPSCRVFAMRDRWGIRPLYLVRFADGAAVCSESTLIDHFGPVEEVPAGSLVTIDGNGQVKILSVQHDKPLSRCSMEFFYFSQPTSMIGGRSYAAIRNQLGAKIAEGVFQEIQKQNLPPPDFTCSVPYSGDDAAEGCADRLTQLTIGETGKTIPLRSVIRKDRFVNKRMFQQEETTRRKLIATKFKIDISRVKGKIILIVDDSIVRGDQSSQLVRMLFDAGAKAVYYASTAPPMPHPCFFGINTPNRKKLIAHGRTVEQIRQMIGCNLLYYLPIEALYEVFGNDCFCTACFNGNYPMPVPNGEVELAEI